MTRIPAKNRVNAGGEGQPQCDGPEHVNLVSENIHRVHVEQGADDDIAGVDSGGDFGQHQAGHGQQAQDIARAAAEAQFQELRHGEDFHAVVERHKDPAQHQDEPAVHFPVSHRHAGEKAGAGQADQMFGADVGRKDRGTDLQPRGVAPSQEVILADSFFFSMEYQTTPIMPKANKTITNQSRLLNTELRTAAAAASVTVLTAALVTES